METGPGITYEMQAEVWLYTGNGAWHFLTLPAEESDQIKAVFGRPRGWGSIPVLVTIGATTWKTSIFPDSKLGAYVLPLKADVRRREGIEAGDSVRFRIAIAS